MNNKRKTLKKVACGSAVVGLASSSWTKPILNTVVLPAHAMTSATVSLDPISDISIMCDPNRGELCVSGDPRVAIVRGVGVARDNLTFDFDIFNGQNIDEDAAYSVVNDPTFSRDDLGVLSFWRGSNPVPYPVLQWFFDFDKGGPTSNVPIDVLPVEVFSLVIRAENPNGESATTSVNINFSIG